MKVGAIFTLLVVVILFVKLWKVFRISRDGSQESFINRYVVRKDYQHPGITTYAIYSTRQDMSLLIRKLNDALASPETSLPRPLAEAVDRSNSENQVRQLWHDYATLAFENTRNVHIEFCIANDLNRFHVLKPAARLRNSKAVLSLYVLGIVFAVVGLLTTLFLVFVLVPIKVFL